MGGVSALMWLSVLVACWINPWSTFDFKKQSADRITSTIHSIITGVMGLAMEAFTTPQCVVRTKWESVPMLLLMGYLVVDFMSMLICDIGMRWRPVDNGMLFH